ncbi:hypothetical protein LOZ80_15985 [Paenibacillus sp. HWE-109]|uniref:glycoside hydrolase family 31 protein n=1 Tax=Paenibacillus sp. HWE-109 TaxID=1306526 RepID=UPI001EDE1EA3|nr:TIM-barrel domain-containing protein [Paenibacillus sp. HWE-109]UKS30348.1 hypothetical protein LOZ80_15985 [Paenibacillus sp. HWE-109]
MQTQHTQSNLDFVLDEHTGQVTITGHRAANRDLVFLSYALIQRGEADRALPLLRLLQSRSGQKEDRDHVLPTDAALVLWVVGEYVKATDDLAFKAELGSYAAATTLYLEANWQRPQTHWLKDESEGIYLSHLAIYFAALQVNVQNGIGERGVRLLKAIRERLFASMIKDGRVISQLGDTAIHGDIVTAAIPFGLLGIEDRILIEALYELEETLVEQGVRFKVGDTSYGGCERPDLTCLLAWYYAKKGDTVRAKELLAHVENLLDKMGWLPEVDIATAKESLLLTHSLERYGEPDVSVWSSILVTLTQASLLSGKSNKEELDSVRLIHQPTGYDDPYVILPYERFPREPQAGDTVIVRLLTQPFQASQIVSVQAAVNGVPAAEAVPAVMKVMDGGEKVWEAQLGPYLAGDEVSYAFALQQGGKSQRSATYSFHVRAWVPLAHVRALETTEDGFVALLAYGAEASRTAALTFRADASGAVQVTFAADGEPANGQPAQQAAVAVGRARLEASVREGKLALVLRSAESELMEGFAAEGKPLVEALIDGAGLLHKLRLNFRTKPEHRWFGMGERFSHYEYSGQEVDQYVYNQYRDQGLKTYMPVPFAISSGGYALFVDTPLYSTFRFHTRLSDLVEVEVDVSSATQQVVAYLFADEPLAMVGQFTQLSGRPMLPPKWSFGPWMSSNNWDSQAEVLKQAELTARYQIPSTVLVIEQWSDEATFYIFNDAQYEVKDGSEPFRYDDFEFPEWGRWPSPKTMVDELHNQGLKVLLWQIPIHKHMYGVAHAQRDQDEITLLKQGYEVKTAAGEAYTLPYNWFKDSHIIDFTNPEASKWWFDKRQYLAEEIGVDGFKTDGGEFVFGHDLQFFDGSTGREMRNLYPNLYVGSYYDFIGKYARDGGITFSRAGYTGAQRYPLHWAGDERSTFEAFRSSMIAGLSSSMSGIPFWGWDLGGFHGDIPTAELFVRSTQMAAFCPVMQYHAETKGEFNQDRTPWNIAERTGQPLVIDLYKKYADIRMNLLPYIYEQAIRTSRTGLPMMRAMSLQYPADPHCTELISQYMFGESLLVAPVMEEGHFSKEVYFPEGMWLSLQEQEEIQGACLLKVAAPLANIPVYQKQNSVIALHLGDDYSLGDHVGNRVDRYEHLCLRIYVTSELETEFEDDLGNHLVMTAKRDHAKVQLQWSGQINQAVTFMLYQPDGVSHVTSSGTELSTVDNVEQLKPGQYVFFRKDVVIATEESAGSLVIEG